MHQNLSYKTNLLYTTRFNLPIAAMLVRLDGRLNVGSLIRSSAAFGFQKVVIVESNRINMRGSVGGHHYVSVDRLPKIDLVAEYLEKNNLSPVFIEQGGQPLTPSILKKIINDISSEKDEKTGLRKSMKPCIILGSESYGVPEEMMKIFPKAPILSITQVGIIKSCNVSCAGGIVMHAFQQAFIQSVEHML
jgi:tRNA G18 (ribose-2'-O)-methylase SpoU